MDFRKYFLLGLKGFGMGAGSVTPCVSAGTVALLTGIYQPFIDSLDSFSKPSTWKALLHGRFGEFWKRINGGFLLSITIGFLVSILALAKLVTWALNYWPIPTWSFFFGLIVASIVLLLTHVKGFRFYDIAFLAAGLGMGVGIFCLTPAETTDALWFIFVCGAVSVCTMVLPGIAGSFVLQIMGKYKYVMEALNFDNLNFPVLLTFALGCIAGILAFSKFLKWLMSRWEKQTLLVLIGFVVGSLVRIWPYSDMQQLADAQLLRTGVAGPLDLQIPAAVISCVIGVALIMVLQLFKRGRD